MAWTRIAGASRSVVSVQGTTTTPPAATDAADGLDLASVYALSVWVDAGVGGTLTSDTGQLDLYQWDAQLWGSAPLVVMQIPPGSSGKRRVCLGTVRVDNARGYLQALTNSVPWSLTTGSVELLVTIDRRADVRAE